VRGIIIMEKQDDDKKTTVAEASSSSGTLQSSSKSSANTQVYSNDEDEAPSGWKVARMSSSSVLICAQQLPKELIGFGSPVLDILMGSLDENSLKNFRRVCKSWEDAARRVLMKRCGLKLEAFWNNLGWSEAYHRVELYSSWIFE
jgi:hypothetical protein